MIIFPFLILFPRVKGACNSQVRAEVRLRLELWGAGSLESLAALARAARAHRPFTFGGMVKSAATQRARALIHKGQFSWAAMLADSFGVAPVSAETFRAIDILLPAPREVNPDDLTELYGGPRQGSGTGPLPPSALIRSGSA